MTRLLMVLNWLAGMTAVFAALLITASVLHALMRFSGWVLRHTGRQHSLADSAGPERFRHLLGTRSDGGSEELRDFRSIGLGLGRSLVLGLQLLLAAEVVHTVALVETSSLTTRALSDSEVWNGVRVVAATAALRVFLAYFLGVEIRREEQGASVVERS